MTVHYISTSRLPFHISIKVISTAIIEHDPDSDYIIVFSFLSSHPRSNFSNCGNCFQPSFLGREPRPHPSSFIHQCFLSTTQGQKQSVLALVQGSQVPMVFDHSGSSSASDIYFYPFVQLLIQFLPIEIFTLLLAKTGFWSCYGLLIFK